MRENCIFVLLFYFVNCSHDILSSCTCTIKGAFNIFIVISLSHSKTQSNVLLMCINVEKRKKCRWVRRRSEPTFAPSVRRADEQIKHQNICSKSIINVKDFSRSPKCVISFYSKQASFIADSSACANTFNIFSTRRLKRETKDIFRSPTDETREAKACATVLGRCRIFIFHSSVKYQKLTATKVHCLLRLLRAIWGVEQIASKTTSDGPEEGRRTAQHGNFRRENRDEKKTWFVAL